MRTRIDKEKGDWSQSTRRSRQNDSNVKEQTKSKRGVDVIESTKGLLLEQVCLRHWLEIGLSNVIRK